MFSIKSRLSYLRLKRTEEASDSPQIHVSTLQRKKWFDRVRFAFLGFAIFLLLNQLGFIHFGVSDLHIFSSFNLYKTKTPGMVLFRRRPEVADVDCKRLIDDDIEYAETLKKERIKIQENPHLNMSCEAVRDRIMMGRRMEDIPKINYSIAFARDVHEVYEYLELQLASSYSLENHYCYSIDLKAPREFQQKIRMLAACLTNVYTPPERQDMDSGGHNINRGHYDCMTILIEQPEWQYLVLQQTYDVVLHTNSEMAEMFKLINGSNDVEITDGVPGGRIDASLDWSLQGLQFITANSSVTEQQLEKAKLNFGKGYVQASLTRAAVHWITKEVNVERLIEQLNGRPEDYGVDEQFIASLQVSETLLMPGSFHYTCRGRTNQWYMTRYTRWGGECKTGNFRASQCIFGVEDLSTLAKNISRRYVMANKFLADYDFGGYSCLSEWVFNKTRDGDWPIDRKHIQLNPQARYNREKEAGMIDIYTYNCSDIPP